MIHQAITHPNTIGEDLRTARRNFGLSQAQLSGLLGMSQTRISRWEGGREDIPTRHRQRIVDFFLNTRGQISPLIETMLRSNPNLAVMDKGALRILRESPLILQAYGLEKSDVEGAEHARIFDAKWKNSAALVEEYCACSYFRDVKLVGPYGEPREFRCQVKIIQVGMEGYDKITIRKNEIIGPSKGEYEVTTMELIMPSSFEIGSID